jgi:DNA-binding protein HU-beta
MALSKKEIVEKIAVKLDIKFREAETLYTAVTDVFFETVVAGEDIKFGDLGKFSTSVSKARVGHNPQDPTKKIEIPSRKRARFSSSKTLKDALNK